MMSKPGLSVNGTPETLQSLPVTVATSQLVDNLANKRIQGTVTSFLPVSSSFGADNQTLLCSESMPSSTPPTDESISSSQEQDLSPWKQTDVLHSSRCSPLSYSSIAKISEIESSPLSREKVSGDLVNCYFQKKSDCVTQRDGNRLDKQMNTNGYDRSRISVSNENLNWLSDITASQASIGQHSSGENLLSSTARPSTGHEMHSVLSSSQAPIGSLFRPPITLSEQRQRIFPGGQYAPLYTTASTTMASYSSLYSIHGQASHLSPYGTYYHQYPHGFPHSSYLPGHYPHIESYSAVLASMGSHAQQVNQSQLPRSFLPSHLSQYSPLGSCQVATPTSSPGPGSIHHSPNQGHPEQPFDSKSPKSDQSEAYTRHLSLHSLSKEEKSHASVSHQAASVVATHKSCPLLKDSSSKQDYKVPCGKEGSLKHRILTRPSNITIEGSTSADEIAQQCTKAEEPSSKRPKTIAGETVMYTPVNAKPETSGPGPHTSLTSGQCPASHLHYPPHFMKGSIIQLANGDLKRVEDLQTDDFVHSAEISTDLKIDSSTVVRIEDNADRGTAILSFLVGEHKVQVTVEATLEHPFFVFGRGWSSCHPEKTIQRYALDCHKLSVGDICISLTHKEVSSRALEITRRHQHSVKVPAVQGSSLFAGHLLAQTHNIETQTKETLVQAEMGGLRKRRWSAPDHVSKNTIRPEPVKSAEAVSGSLLDDDKKDAQTDV